MKGCLLMTAPLTEHSERNWEAKISRLTQTHPWQDTMRIPGKFYCLLDEQPDELVPERFQSAARIAAQNPRDIILNPLCWFSDEGPPPLAITTKLPLLENFILDCSSIWVGDPITGIYAPFVIGPAYQQLLQDLRDGILTIQELPLHVRTNLLLARIITKRDFLATQRQEWARKVSQANAQFQQGHYAALQDMLPPLMIGALRRYYRQLIQLGDLPLGDSQCPQRYVVHNESVTLFWHQQFADLVKRVVGTAVQPSYVYFGAYQRGAVLEPHRDRAQCEYTMTFCIDFSPEPENETPWPIYIETPAGAVATYQAIGDGLIFKGHELIHYRHKLEEGSCSTSLFFHYVSKDFQGHLI
jgi:hypothetical protein